MTSETTYSVHCFDRGEPREFFGLQDATEAHNLAHQLSLLSQYEGIRVVAPQTAFSRWIGPVRASITTKMHLIRDIRQMFSQCPSGVLDTILIALARGGVIALHEHGSVGLLPERERVLLLRLDEGEERRWFNAVSAR